MTKKILTLILTLIFALGALAGCSSDQAEKQKDSNTSTESDTQDKTSEKQSDTKESTDINIGCMKGPTAIGMIHLLSESDAGSSHNHYEYTIAGTGDELSAALIKGDLDIAAVPCNMASILNQKTNGEIVTAALNTLGVLYIVEAGDSIQTVSDLKGKTLYSTGQGTTPEYTLRYLLTTAGLNPDTDVTIEYKSEATEVVAALAQNKDAVAMLPQPYVTIAMNNNDKLRIALDITKEWESSCDSTVVTGVLVARKSFIEQHPEAFEAFLEEYKASTDYANKNIDETSALLEKYDVFKAAIAKKAIPYCNVTFIDGKEMQEKVSAYLQVLFDQNPKSVGGSVPKEGLFYIENK